LVVVERWRVGDGRVGFSAISFPGGWLGRVCLGEHTSEASSKELIACNALLRLVEAATAAAGGVASALASIGGDDSLSPLLFRFMRGLMVGVRLEVMGEFYRL
jgi:hypothetical protein